jgi:hypothetical protein
MGSVTKARFEDVTAKQYPVGEFVVIDAPGQPTLVFPSLASAERWVAAAEMALRTLSAKLDMASDAPVVPVPAWGPNHDQLGG